MRKSGYRTATVFEYAYHVRSKDGVTIHWMDFRVPAEKLARAEGYHVYEVNKLSGVAMRVF